MGEHVTGTGACLGSLRSLKSLKSWTAAPFFGPGANGLAKRGRRRALVDEGSPLEKAGSSLTVEILHCQWFFGRGFPEVLPSSQLGIVSPELLVSPELPELLGVTGNDIRYGWKADEYHFPTKALYSLPSILYVTFKAFPVLSPAYREATILRYGKTVRRSPVDPLLETISFQISFTLPV